jgi:hypothetical protein
MKKIIILFGMALLLAGVQAKAQSLGETYQTALGIKLWGDGGGASIKHFIMPSQALEGIVYFWDRGTRVTGLYEFHFDITGAPGLKWYVGPGAHVGFYNNHYQDRYGNFGNGGSFTGIDGVLGLDYKFTGAPINLSIDWQPSIEFGDNRGFFGGWGGLGVRYTF